MGEEERIRIKVMGPMFGGFAKPTCAGGRYEFTYDTACDAYDWLVVFDELPVAFEELRCPKERTILCTWEPMSIKGYSRAYTRQFGYLLTNRPPEAERHPHYCLGRGYFPWFVRDFPKCGEVVDKPKAISAVCSAKQMRHTKHHARFGLVRGLANAIPEMDWYGKGVKPLDRKEDALVPYRYHVAIENHIAPHHWTEKFSDAILCECLPFYAGDPVLTEIFPKESFIPIPIDDPAETLRIVRTSIAADEYAKRREAVLEAKRLILKTYNFWHQVIALVEEAGVCLTRRDVALAGGRIYSRKELRKRDLFAALEDGWGHLRRFADGCLV